MGEVGLVAFKVSWLRKLTSVLWCMKLDLFSLDFNEVSSVNISFLWHWSDFGKPLF